MWLSEQIRPAPLSVDADLGVTTITGDQVGVMTRGEVRALPVYGPGGYVWIPGNGAEVLVIKGGPGGEEQSVAGMQQKQVPKGMEPGEVYLYGPAGNTIYLKRNGEVEIRGHLIINGEDYKPCTHGKGGL